MMPFRINYTPALWLSLLLQVTGPLLAQEEAPNIQYVDTIDTSADIFNDEEPMRITLTFDLKKYQREKFKGEYMPVHFLYQFKYPGDLEIQQRIDH